MPEIEQKSADPKSNSSDNLIAEAYFGTAEKTYFKSPMVSDSFFAPFNADDLWQKTGDYSIYEEMLNDDQVSICSKLKKDLIIGSGYDLVPDGDDDQEDIIEFLYKVFNSDIEAQFLNRLEEMLGCYDYGFSITEKIFKKKDDGLITLKDFKTRHPNSWQIHQDDHGNITNFEQITTVGNINVPYNSLIHMVANEKFQNPYGTSDLRACYNAYFAKRQVIRFYAIFMEKAASPIPVARYDKNAPQSAVDKIFAIIKKFQTKTAIAIPKEIEVDFLESKSSGEAYSKAINIFNMFIGRSLFVPDLLGLTGSETGGGSFSLGKEQINIFFMHIKRRRSYLENIIQKHIIEPICRYNFGDMEYYPCFKFKPLDDMEALELAKVWLDAVKSRVFKPSEEEVNYFRTLCKFPEGDVEFQGDITPPIPGQPLTTNKAETEEEDDAKEVESSDKKEFGKIFNLPKGDYYKKVDFKAMEAKLDDYDKSVVKESQPVINKIYNDIYDQIAKKKILDKKDITKVETIKVKYLKELKTILKSSFMGIYKDGQIQAQSELFKANFRQPTTSEEFLRVLEDETFAYIGDWEYNITKAVRNQLVVAIKEGKPLSVVMDILDDEGKKLSEQSLERYARTKHTEVMNRGRLEFFESSGVVAAYQYSAVMDERTSDICRGLDGKIFKAGTEPVPSLHFNALLEGSLISTNSGSKPIEEIKIGDEVLTHKNRYQKVYDTMSKFEDKEYYEIELDNGQKINITGEHPIYTTRGWIIADHIKMSDDIICRKDIVHEL